MSEAVSKNDDLNQKISDFFDSTGNLTSMPPSSELVRLLCEKYYKTGNWIIPHRFRNFSNVLGEGAYGQVIKAYDCLTQSEVAIKKIKTPFNNQVNAVRSFREVHVLARLDHENCISMLFAYIDQESRNLGTFYLVMPAFGAPLNEVMRKNRLTDQYVQWITFQLISAIQYLHSLNLIHRDIKPENILINEDCHLKLIDFGLARMCSSESFMTGYVVTRYYRAPEIITSWQRYDKSVDVWSVGCVVGELLTGTTLFRGLNHIDQIMRICQVCGTPSSSYLDKVDSDSRVFFVQQIGQVGRMNFLEKFSPIIAKNQQIERCSVNPDSIKIVDMMLQIDPSERPSVDGIFEHSYFRDIEGIKEWMEKAKDIKKIDFHGWDLEETENGGTSIEIWRNRVFDEIEEFQSNQIQNIIEFYEN